MNTYSIIARIGSADSKSLGPLLERINCKIFEKNGWNIYSVKAAYKKLLFNIDNDLHNLEIALYCGTERWNYNEIECSTFQAKNNLEVAKDFFNNPPILTKPNDEVEKNTSIERKTETSNNESNADSTTEETCATVEIVQQHKQRYSENVHDGYAFGYKGIMEAFGWGRTKIAKVLKDEKYAAAIEQNGKKIAVNIEKMHELLRLSNKKKGAPRRR